MIDRGDYWQCAYIIRKGSFDELKTQGIEALQRGIVELVPALSDRVAALDDWSKVSMLEVRVDRLERWHRPGLLCIGDAAMRCRRSAASGSTLQFKMRSPRRTSSPIRWHRPNAERCGTTSRSRTASLPHQGDASFSSFRAGPCDRSDLAGKRNRPSARWLYGSSTSFRSFVVSPRA